MPFGTYVGAKVEIRGRCPDTVLLVDGEIVRNCKAFTIKAPGPDQPTTLILELDVGDLDVQGDLEVEVKHV